MFSAIVQAILCNMAADFVLLLLKLCTLIVICSAQLLKLYYATWQLIFRAAFGLAGRVAHNLTFVYSFVLRGHPLQGLPWQRVMRHSAAASRCRQRQVVHLHVSDFLPPARLKILAHVPSYGHRQAVTRNRKNNFRLINGVLGLLS